MPNIILRTYLNNIFYEEGDEKKIPIHAPEGLTCPFINKNNTKI